VEVWLNIVLD
jgi:hypothetical protein